MATVLVACEFSGTVRDAFIAQGHDAVSCDLLPTLSAGPHHQGCVHELLRSGKKFDLIIAHPPCTWLCNAMASNAARKDRPTVTPIFKEEREKAYDFAISFFEYADHVAVENPVGYIGRRLRKADQMIRPYMFGHIYKKPTCLWLKGLPNLEPTCLVEGPYKKLDFHSKNRNPNGFSLKSITFKGIADAMAKQWGDYVQEQMSQPQT